MPAALWPIDLGGQPVVSSETHDDSDYQVGLAIARQFSGFCYLGYRRKKAPKEMKKIRNETIPNEM